MIYARKICVFAKKSVPLHSKMINNMKKYFLMLAALLMAAGMMAEMTPIYYEGFTNCFDEEGENYGYTGGNDGQWGGDIAKAQVIYQDAPEWSFTYCNAGYQCLKVGTSAKQGSATTPVIPCEGEAVLSFRVAPWEGDSIFYVSINGGITSDQTYFNLKKHQWTDVTIHIADITGSLKISFSSTNKHRFFLDEIYVRPEDPTVGVIRTPEGSMVDFGLVGRSYSACSRTIKIEGVNLTGAISASLEEGEPSLFQLSAMQLPATGGELTLTFKSGASEGAHGCYLYLRGKDANTHADVVKRVTLSVEVASLNLEGSGTKPDPYTCADVIMLAANEGTVWTGVRYWVTGFVLGGVKRYNDQYDGISMTDNQSLVLAASPDEADDSKYVTVQISDNARAALNVVDNPELVGKQVKVQGLLLNNNANPLYLGKPGVRDVRTDAHYVRPDKEGQGLDAITQDRNHGTKRLVNGQLLIEYNSKTYNAFGQSVK